MPEEKLKLCPFCGEIPHVAIATDEGFSSLIPKNISGLQSYRVICGHCEAWGQPNIVKQQAIEAWNTRPAEKLVPLNIEVVTEWFWLIDNDPKSRSMAEDFCARFGSVPVVPVVVWPDKKDLQGIINIFGRGSPDACIACGYNEAIDKCKSAHAKAIEFDKSYMGDGKTTNQEAKERKG